MGQYSCERNSEKKYERISGELSGELNETSLIEALEELKERKEIEEHYVKSTIDWDELPDTLTLYVDHYELARIVNEARDIVGPKELEKEDIMSNTLQQEVVYGNKETITVGKLKLLLDIVGIPHDEMNIFIYGIGDPGNPYTINNPRLPFNFDSEAGGIVLAAALKDGTIHKEEAKGYWFAYYNKDEKNRERVKEAVRKVFGDVEPHESKERNEISYHSYAIVSALEKMGAPIGEKVGQDYHVPQVVRMGSESVKRAYLHQTFMDEGSWSPDGSNFKYPQAGALDPSKLSEDDKRYFEGLLNKQKEYPTGYTYHYVYLSEELGKEIREEYPRVWAVIEGSKPPFLEEEMDILEEVCGVRPEPKPREIYTTTEGDYRVSWRVEISKKEEWNRVRERLRLPRDKHRHEG
ncbi:MAG: hypothetical protein QW542_04265 [Thermoproteota archaeon]